MIEQKFKEFMYGRYGMDQLNIALMFTGLVVALVNAFIKSYILTFIVTVLFLWEMFRAFSRKIHARRRENDIFLQIWSPIWKWFRTRRTRFKERDMYRYRSCPKCKATLRLPARKGKHTARCPRCGEEFEVRI